MYVQKYEPKYSTVIANGIPQISSSLQPVLYPLAPCQIPPKFIPFKFDNNLNKFPIPEHPVRVLDPTPSENTLKNKIVKVSVFT